MARCSSRWMIRVQVAHVCFFGIFCLLVYMLKGIGLHAVIYATSVSMFLRCVLAVYFIRYGEEKENPKAKEGDGQKPVEKAELSLGRITIAALLLLASGQVCGRKEISKKNQKMDKDDERKSSVSFRNSKIQKSNVEECFFEPIVTKRMEKIFEKYPFL